ncbi:MAG: hypothetical protein ACXADL_06090 [Candidatus Thorarchaeota archaeon]|jgi:hypothetical protein
MNWLAKIVNGTPDDFVHAKLVKYGIGNHPGPRIVMSLSKARITFKADLDIEKTFVKAYLEGAPEENTKVKGMVISYVDREEEFEKLRMPIYFKKSKGKSATSYKAKLDEVAPLEDIRSLVEIDDPTTFFLLSMNPTSGAKPWKITTKTSFPKGGPKEKEDGKKEKDPVFTKGALANSPELLDFIAKNFLPDAANEIDNKTKKIDVRNTILIEDIEIPDDPSLSFSEKRKLAKKKGKLQRRITIDGVVFENEFPFLA